MAYFTQVQQALDKRAPGQTLKFKKGKGYYLTGTVLPYEGYLSPQTRLAQAKTVAAAQQRPALDEFHRQQDEATQQADQNRKALAAFSTAAAGMMKNDPAQIRGAFADAADTQAGFAKGFSGTIADDATQSNEANAAVLRKLGLPTALGPVDSGADALYARSGYIPGGTFAEEGATAYGHAVARKSDYLAGSGEQQQLQLQKGDEARRDIQTQINNLLAQRPGLIQQVMGDLQSSQTGLWATQVQQDYLRKAQQESAGLDAFGKPQPGYTIGTLKNGTQVKVPPGYVVKGNSVVKPVDATRAAVAANTKKQKKIALRQAAVAKRNGAVQQATTSIAKAVLTEPLQKTVKDPFGLDPDTVKRMDWNAAREYLWNVYGKDLLVYSSKAGSPRLKRTIMSKIDGILRSNGFKPRARPVTRGQAGPPAPGRTQPGPFLPRGA